MLRAILCIAGLLGTVWVIALCFGYTTPQVTSLIPGLNRSALHAASLMSGSATENGREPAGDNPASAPAPGGPASAPDNSPAATTDNAPLAPSNPPRPADEAEIISPDTTDHLNPAHIHDIDQPTPAWASGSGTGTQAFNPNPAAFVPPNPLPAHPHWTWDVANREFTNVVVTHVDADLVAIASDTGPAQIDIALLPAEIRRELHYDPVLAAEAAAARKTPAGAVTTSSP